MWQRPMSLGKVFSERNTGEYCSIAGARSGEGLAEAIARSGEGLAKAIAHGHIEEKGSSVRLVLMNRCHQAS